MNGNGLGINANDIGIGATLRQFPLMVPPNQRSYAWEKPHIQTLFEDLTGAISIGDQPYFLGTLVLTTGDGERLEVADGQQRLATASILIAAIRDYLEAGSDAERKAATKYTSEYLVTYDEMTGEHVPRFKLNYEDNDFFLNQILVSASEGKRQSNEPQVPSHQRLFQAAELAKAHVANIVAPYGQPDKAKELYKWIKFLDALAMVISIKVPNHINAYTMFETLNDRGLRASQIDILKNYLFGKAQDRLDEIQMKWSSMIATIETVGDEDLLLTYLRHYWTLTHGYTAERELAALVKNEIVGRQQAVTLVVGLDDTAPDYANLLNPLENVGWAHLDKEARAYVFVITNILAIEQILPLLLAILKKFEVAQIKSSLKMLLCWSVRFLVAGSGGGGPLDRAYGQLAKEIMDGTIKSASQLRSNVRAGVLRTDAEFIQAFSKARVTKTVLARYYLRALELAQQGTDSNAELGGTLDDSFTMNVEHVLPQRESDGWDIDEQTAQQFRKRLGNMILLNPSTNVKLGNKPFSEKREAYAKSPYLLTQKVGEYTQWGPDEIDDWQDSLAQIAVKVWPES